MKKWIISAILIVLAAGSCGRRDTSASVAPADLNEALTIAQAENIPVVLDFFSPT